MSKVTAIYVRVSTRRQGTESQEPDLKRWAESHAGEVRWYRDRFTGRTMHRKGFDALTRDIHAGLVGAVVVWRLDRLGRTAKGLTALFEDFTARKINLVSLRDGLDLSTPAGRLMANVVASVAQYESEIKSENILAGLEVAKANGVKLGRPTGPGKAIKVTPEQEEAIVRLKSEGKKIAAIARTTGLSRPTVYKVLG
jgi:DNA invertase Pin-like site-specific DNA recombinase